MSRAALSVIAFGIYLAFLGPILVVIPNVFLSVFGIESASEVWIRVVGMLLFLLAFYYIQAARHELTVFLRATVYARASVIVFFTAFVLLGLAEPLLILFGAIDLAAAVWTALALRADSRS
ncbi:MAG: hypothetical protein JRG91_08410 [Deltaproteobacteria bacterium]|nr:hypothetical protein [Deltaproteobacteria bacterium]